MEKISSISYLLHAQPYKETSLLIRMFGKELGRFSLIAKGVKRKQSQALRAILQPFICLNIEFVGRHDLKTLCGAELAQRQSRLPGRALACGYYLNELLIRSTQEGQEFPELFSCYENSLNLLKQQANFSEVLRDFEICLLQALGISPSWDFDLLGESICETGSYRYVSESGFSRINEREIKNKSTVSSNLFSGTAIIALGTGNYPENKAKECQQLCQLLLRKIIGSKPLESRKLWV